MTDGECGADGADQPDEIDETNVPEDHFTAELAESALDPVSRTRAVYDSIGPAYARRNEAGPIPDWIATQIDWLAAGLKPGARVADVGCGPGLHTRLLRERGFRAHGFDLSLGMLTSARVPGLVQADMRALPLRGRALDAVWCCAALLHVPRPQVQDVLREFARVLRPGGLLVLSVAEGDEEFWEPVPYAPQQRRWYVQHRLEGIAAQVTGARLAVLGFERRSTHRDWITLRARRT